MTTDLPQTSKNNYISWTNSLTLSSPRLKTQQDIWSLKQCRNSAMIPLCPLQVWCSSVHTPLRSIQGFGPQWKIWRRKCAKLWITLPQIARFCSTFTEGLDTWCWKYHKSSRSTAWRNRGKKFDKLRITQPGIVRFRSIYYRLWPRDNRSTTNFQGQRVKGQGHSVTWRISVEKSLHFMNG